MGATTGGETDDGDSGSIRLGRRIDGTTLVGDEAGFVPLSAAAPSIDRPLYAATRPADGNPEARPDLASIDLDDATASRVPADEIGFGVPFSPGKLWGIGLNYADHAADLEETTPEDPASFLKPHTALEPPSGTIRLPEPSDRVTAEAELGVVIGRTCSDVPPEAFSEVVAGFVPVIDMTAEDILERNPRFLTRAKSFDSFLVVGPWLSVPATRDRLEEITVRTMIDDTIVAENTLDAMMHPPPELVSYHSRDTTLRPGDLISTGTPGAGAIEPGDTVRAEVETVGSVSADVVGQ